MQTEMVRIRNMTFLSLWFNKLLFWYLLNRPRNIATSLNRENSIKLLYSGSSAPHRRDGKGIEVRGMEGPKTKNFLSKHDQDTYELRDYVCTGTTWLFTRWGPRTKRRNGHASAMENYLQEIMWRLKCVKKNNNESIDHREGWILLYSEQYFVEVIGQILQTNNERFFNYSINKNLVSTIINILL